MKTFKLSVANLNSMYMNQIVTGFIMLKQQEVLDFVLSEKLELKDEFSHDAIVECVFKNKRIIFDLTDGYNNYPSFAFLDRALDNVDYYFKSCVQREYHLRMRNKHKILTLPFRYYVTLNNIYLNYMRIKLARRTCKFKEIIRCTTSLLNSSYCHRYVKRFEYPAVVNREKNVFFYTRLWDPSIASSKSSKNVDLDGCLDNLIAKKAQEYKQISDMRALCIMALKKEFGKSFIGEIVRSDYAEKMYPDLIVNTQISSRKAYTKAIHSSDICVTTQGTHQCFNFSFGEELAASKGLVTEKPFYELPDFFKENINFLSYSNPLECVEKTDMLFNDNEKLLRMMKANEEYYLQYNRPDKMIINALNKTETD